MKRHGLVWWLFIGWWYWLFFGWWIALLRFAFRQAKNTPKQKAGKHRDNTENHRVAGISLRTEEVMTLAVENPDYKKTKKQLLAAGLTDRTIYEYNFRPAKAELVPEPDNPHDPKAIKVIADGQHIGYIKSGSCAHIHNLLKDNRIVSANCQISGGRYKSLSCLGQIEYEDHVERDYTLESDKAPFSATITIQKTEE